MSRPNLLSGEAFCSPWFRRLWKSWFFSHWINPHHCIHLTLISFRCKPIVFASGTLDGGRLMQYKPSIANIIYHLAWIFKVRESFSFIMEEEWCKRHAVSLIYLFLEYFRSCSVLVTDKYVFDTTWSKLSVCL